jgi:hypothetical protein
MAVLWEDRKSYNCILPVFLPEQRASTYMSTNTSGFESVSDVTKSESVSKSEPLPAIAVLAKLWGRRYTGSLLSYSQSLQDSEREQFVEAASLEGRAQTARKLLSSLNFASAQAWGKTEMLLAEEVRRHRIDPKLIDPWQVARESHQLFGKVLTAYQQGKAPQQLATVIGPECGRVRRLFTAKDPRIIGFVSMQIHYSSQMLLEPLPKTNQMLIEEYFKVLDDHLYMPLQRAYEAAANHLSNSPQLKAVQALLPISSSIATDICQQVIQEFGAYRSYSGALEDSKVKVSSIRDVEMFQIYLCVCLLENNIAAFQEELFPLCVMLYPPLQVKWELVRLLGKLLDRSIQRRLPGPLVDLFHPYLTAMQCLFMEDVVEYRIQ